METKKVLVMLPFQGKERLNSVSQQQGYGQGDQRSHPVSQQESQQILSGNEFNILKLWLYDVAVFLRQFNIACHCDCSIIMITTFVSIEMKTALIIVKTERLV